MSFAASPENNATLSSGSAQSGALRRGDKVALVAGSGDLPLLLARSLKSKGVVVSAVAFKGHTSSDIASAADTTAWVALGSLDEVLEAIRSSGASYLILSGKIEHKYIFTKKLDASAAELFAALADARAENILSALAAKFAQMGVKVLPQTVGLEHLLAGPGTLGQRAPSVEELADIALGRTVASALAGLDCGQTVVVKKGVVVALEGVEGTDETIKRAGNLAGLGIVVVKMSRPKQDMRFDVPVVGESTLRAALDAGARVIAVESGKTLLLDPRKMASFADVNDMVLYGV
ncbi:MAG: UDP-2,3-diacylglucosamine diphosphatase LpxI [Endomicrobiia bacterium]|nr:UDP-2,3-diacylglucosamine diphosphatase LpxI [Endomicrobiia bacterium]